MSEQFVWLALKGLKLAIKMSFRYQRQAGRLRIVTHPQSLLKEPQQANESETYVNIFPFDLIFSLSSV